MTSSTAMVNPPGISRHLRNGVDVKLGPLPPWGSSVGAARTDCDGSLPLSGRCGHNEERWLELGTPIGRRARIAVLEAFTSASPALTLSELARRTGLPLTTTHRLLAELCGAGALEREGDGTYRVGLRLWEIASLAPRRLPLREAALPFLEDLYEVTHENVQLGVREGHDVVYIERIAGRR